MKPVCLYCQAQYKIKKNGAYVIETRGPYQHQWRLWRADVWRCPGCDHDIINGFGQDPISEDYRKNWHEVLQKVADGPDPVYSVHEFPHVAIAEAVR